MDTNKSIWKKKLFSDRKPDTDADFGTAHMIHKIARVNKKKRRNKIYNYKNIETFENIHEPAPPKNLIRNNKFDLDDFRANGSKSGDLKPNGTWDDTDIKQNWRGVFENSDGKYYVVDPSGNKYEYDGPQENGIPLTPDYWEGLDFGDKGMGADDPRQRLLDLIEKIDKWVTEFNKSQARTLANVLQQAVATTLKAQLRKDSEILVLRSTKSLKEGMIIRGDGIPPNTVVAKIKDINYVAMNNKATKTGSMDINFYENAATDKDVNIITPYICLVETVIVAYFFTYNLVYATMYIDRETKRTIYIPRFTSNNVKIATLNQVYGMVFRPIVYFFTYALYFSDVMQYLIYDVLPNNFKKYLNLPIYFIAVFFTLVYLIENVRPFFKQFIRDVILLNTNNQVVNVMYALVIVWYIMDFDILSPVFKNLYGAITSFFVSIDPAQDKPKAEEEEKAEEKKAEKKHKHKSNCSQCGMISLNMCGSCGMNICGQCNIMHSCKKDKDTGTDWFGNFKLPNFSINGITDMLGGVFSWFDRVSVGGNMTPLYLLIYQFTNLLNTAMSPVFSIIYTVFQFIIVLAISVPLGAIFCFSILLLICTSMLWYPFSTLSVQKIANMWMAPLELNEFIQMSFLLNFDPKDPNLSPKQMGEMAYAIGFDFIFTYLLFIAIVVVLVLAMVDFNKNIGNPQLKTNISMLLGVLIAINVIPLIVSFLTKIRQDRMMTPEIETFNKEAAEQLATNITKSKLIPPMGPQLAQMKNTMSSIVPNVDPSKAINSAKEGLKSGVGAVMNNPLTKLARGIMDKFRSNPGGTCDADDSASKSSESEDLDDNSDDSSSDDSFDNEDDDKSSDSFSDDSLDDDDEGSDKDEDDDKEEDSDKKDSDKEEDDKEDSDKEEDDKEDSDKEEDDKEEDDKEDDDKEEDDKEDDDKEEDDKEEEEKKDKK